MRMDRLWAGWRAVYVKAAGDVDGTTGQGAGYAPTDDESDGDASAADAAVMGAGTGLTTPSVFTEIVRSGVSDEEARIVHRGDLVFTILNAYPYASGHMLILPYREVGELEDLTSDESAELWSVTQDAVVAVKAAYSPHGVNVGINLGTAAGAGIPSHLHVHVLPRWDADSNFMTAVAEARVLPESLGDSWARLVAAWPPR